MENIFQFVSTANVGVSSWSFIKFQWKCIHEITQFLCCLLSFDGLWLTTRNVFSHFSPQFCDGKRPQNMKVKWSFCTTKKKSLQWNFPWVNLISVESGYNLITVSLCAFDYASVDFIYNSLGGFINRARGFWFHYLTNEIWFWKLWEFLPCFTHGFGQWLGASLVWVVLNFN